ncbi:hypothetical protein [Paenibacillus sinopodophylli]|uniref:hypothetical protein n=1 Tax=Paenibacillus sinopodophylli TaxID=1837342 RepID=UPI00110CCE79|nr:hypothetical protein [Paenibacillus sinopodophylli]
MINTAIWLEQDYCSNQIKDAYLKTRNFELKIPFSEKQSDYEICRFKLIAEEVQSDKQRLLDSDVLGKKIAEVEYDNVSFSESEILYYSHENIFTDSENKTIQKAVIDGVLRQKNLYQRENIELSGEYHVNIQVFRKEISQPDFLSGEAPPILTDYEQKIETITVYILIFKDSIDPKKNSKFSNASVYGSLGNLGFFMVDLDLFHEFIRSEVGDGVVNLVELFTTTDLVEKCFEEGLLIITWGIKPWHYYIQAMNNSIIFDECTVSGTYKIKNKTKKLSVIPGNELLAWPKCLEKEWPTICLEGDGEKIVLSLYTYSGNLGNEIIPTYILRRSEEHVEHIEPIINYNFLD